MHPIKQQHGFVTLLAVLIIAAIGGGAITVYLAATTAGTRTGQARIDGATARATATACAEHALEQIRSNISYTGSDNLTVNSASCNYTVSNTGGQNRTIQATGTSNDAVHRLVINITSVNPLITVNDWQDVSSF